MQECVCAQFYYIVEENSVLVFFAFWAEDDDENENENDEDENLFYFKSFLLFCTELHFVYISIVFFYSMNIIFLNVCFFVVGIFFFLKFLEFHLDDD